jgi:hypothetical protein
MYIRFLFQSNSILNHRINVLPQLRQPLKKNVENMNCIQLKPSVFPHLRGFGALTRLCAKERDYAVTSERCIVDYVKFVPGHCLALMHDQTSLIVFDAVPVEHHLSKRSVEDHLIASILSRQALNVDDDDDDGEFWAVFFIVEIQINSVFLESKNCLETILKFDHSRRIERIFVSKRKIVFVCLFLEIRSNIINNQYRF